MRSVKDSAGRRIGALILAFALICVAGTAWAQDPVKVAPNHFKVLLDNDQVRVLDFQSKAGDKVPMHSHPVYVTYGLAGAGKTRFTSADGKSTEQPVKSGQALWHEAETHASEYSGTGTIHVLLIELKPHAPRS
jgi:quercetin dioxygenase-like cupin family protein